MQFYTVKNKKAELDKAKITAKKLNKNSKKLSNYVLFCDMKNSTAIKYTVKETNGIIKILTHNEFCTKIIEEYEGKVIKELGDGLLAIFTKQELAFTAALEIITNLKKHEKAKPEIQTKIAIAYGEFRIITRKIKDINGKIQELDDVFGKPIDFCARILSKADANSIFFPTKLKRGTKLVLQDNKNTVMSKSFSKRIRLEKLEAIRLLKISLS